MHFDGTALTSKPLADALYRLPDSEYGAGNLPEGCVFWCVLCESEIEAQDKLGAKFGKFVHLSCAREWQDDASKDEGDSR